MFPPISYCIFLKFLCVLCSHVHSSICFPLYFYVKKFPCLTCAKYSLAPEHKFIKQKLWQNNKLKLPNKPRHKQHCIHKVKRRAFLPCNQKHKFYRFLNGSTVFIFRFSLSFFMNCRLSFRIIYVLYVILCLNMKHFWVGIGLLHQFCMCIFQNEAKTPRNPCKYWDCEVLYSNQLSKMGYNTPL